MAQIRRSLRKVFLSLLLITFFPGLHGFHGDSLAEASRPNLTSSKKKTKNRSGGAQTRGQSDQISTGEPPPADRFDLVGVGQEHQAAQPQITGFFVNWDDASFASLKDNIHKLDKIMPEWLHLVGDDGTIFVDGPAKQTVVLDYIHQTRPDLKVMPLINNYNESSLSWDGRALARILARPASRQKLIHSLYDYVQSNHMAGVNVDFEGVPNNAQTNLHIFMSELYQTFHASGLEVSQDVPFGDPQFDFAGYAKTADALVLMAYDEHYSRGEAGPIASQDWLINTLKDRMSEVATDKLVVALGTYGYDWVAGTRRASARTYEEAITLAQAHGATIHLDHDSLNATFDYTDAHGHYHHVWLLDAVTAFNQIAASLPYQIQGYALWRLGSEDPSLWTALEQRMDLNQSVADQLKVFQYGKREIVFDTNSGLITEERTAGA